MGSSIKSFTKIPSQQWERISQWWFSENDLKALAINVLTTAAESPWSNRVVERHKEILAAVIDIITEDRKYSHKIALSWVLKCKIPAKCCWIFCISIGFSQKSKLSLQFNGIQALPMKLISGIIQENLNAIHRALVTFITVKNNKKIYRNSYEMLDPAMIQLV